MCSLLLVVDSFSKWLEVFVVPNMTAETTIERMRTLFASYGIPEEIVSDNGPQLTSHEFKTFLRRNNVKHVLTPPYHPQSNGAIERCVQTTKQALGKQVLDSPGTSLQHKLANFLRSYRNTPHTTTQKTPAEVFLGWLPRTHLSMLKPSLAQFVEQRQRALEEKTNVRRQMPQFHNQELVWVKSRRNEETNWLPGQVVAKKSPLTFRVSVGGQPAEQLVHAEHLRPRQSQGVNHGSPSSPAGTPVKTPVVAAADGDTTDVAVAATPPPPRRTGRARRAPARLQL